MLDARVWLLWVLTTLVVASSARNPLYGVLLLLITTVVGTVCAPEKGHGGRRNLFSPLRFAALVIPLSALFNSLTVHIGETRLFTLPDWLPLLGGPITLEAVAFGAQNGLALAAIFAGFAVFNQVTPVRDLVGLTPRAFHEIGVVVSIALTFIPQTTRSLTRIRQAQAVRGHRMHGLHDWPPIIVPLLISGLERSMGLAEAMVARGYGSVADQSQSLRTSGSVIAGLLALLAGWLIYLFRPAQARLGMGLLLAGALVIAATVCLAGRSVQHSVYRPRRWTVRDTLTVVGCGLALAATLALPSLLDTNPLYYSPYPRLEPPLFDPLVGLGLLALLAPAVAGTAGEYALRAPRPDKDSATEPEQI